MPPLYGEIAPAPRLAPYVECYWYRTDAAPDPAHRVLPDGCADILFTRLDGQPASLALAGLMTTPLFAPLPAGQSIFGVRFRPAMASLFFPGASLCTDRLEPLDNLAPTPARQLYDRLSNAPTPASMAALCNSLLRPLEPQTAAHRALALLESPDLTLDSLARHASLSPRHLRRLCLARSGVGPKFLARILRFRRAVALLHAAASRPAAPCFPDIALASGYYDQSHFIADFRQFALSTPVRFFQSLRPAPAPN